MAPEQLDRIRSYAALQFSQQEIEVLLGMEIGTIETDPAADQAFWSGRLNAQAVIRKAIYENAKAGNVNACRLLHEISTRSDVT
jgi:hypothetical protein